MCGVLARMELEGMPFEPSWLEAQRPAVEARLRQLSARAEQLAGHPINLASAAQLAVVLYEEMGIPQPQHCGEL
jgi:DNA polymerase-1